MITGAVAWALTELPKKGRTLGRVFDLFVQDDVAYGLAAMLDNKKVTNTAARAAFASFLQLPTEATRPSVLASLRAGALPNLRGSHG